jgi:DNA-binding CsgD family transcriptional regulator
VAGAWSTYAAGSDRAARERFAAIAGDARRRGEAFVELEALYARARLGEVGDVVTRIGEVAALIDGAYAPLVAQHCRALHSNRADALDGISSEFAALGYRVNAAEAAAAAAALHHDAREPARAEASRARVDRELAACPGARPRQLHGWRLRSALTARELDVARLAALGRPTRAIAEELFVSARTVDTHLAHIYTKLAIAGRHELPTALGENHG